MTSRSASAHGGCDHTVWDREWEAAVPPHPRDQRPGAQQRPDMVNVLGWVEACDPPAGPGTPTSVAVQAWVNNVAFVKDVWTDVYLLAGDGAVLCGHPFPLAFVEPAEGNGDCFVADLAAFRPPSSPAPPRRLQFRLYYRVDGALFTDGLLHDHDLAEPTAAEATTPSRGSLMVSMLLLHQASARARRRS